MKGKQVRCVYTNGSPFVQDAVYVLAEDPLPNGKYIIVGAESAWNKFRFVSVLGVRCINLAPSSEDGDPSTYLKLGEVYNVINVYGSSHWVLDLPRIPGQIPHRNWYHARFEQVWEAPISKVSSKNYDADEERYWMLMRPHVAPDECICGIKRIMCDYHRR